MVLEKVVWTAAGIDEELIEKPSNAVTYLFPVLVFYFTYATWFKVPSVAAELS